MPGTFDTYVLTPFYQAVVAIQYTLDEAAAPASPAPGSPSSPSPAEDATKVTVDVPVVFFTAHLTAYNPDTFTSAVQQQQYIAALKAASLQVELLVVLTNIRAGSVMVDTTLQFLVSNGNTAAADALAATLRSDPSSILPSAAWGDVAASGLVQSTATITVPSALLSAPAAKMSKTTVLVAALVGGIGGAVLLAGAAICICKLRRSHSRGVPVSQAMMSEPSSPASPTAFLQGRTPSAIPAVQ